MDLILGEVSGSELFPGRTTFKDPQMDVRDAYMHVCRSYEVSRFADGEFACVGKCAISK